MQNTEQKNVAAEINNAETIVVRWHEGYDMVENEKLSVREFRGLLAELREQAEAEGYGDVDDASVPSCYIKVAFLANGKSWRIDVTAHPSSIRFENAWIY